MSNLENLLTKYRDERRTNQICSALDSKTPVKIQLKGITGSQESFVLAGMMLKNPRNILVIAKDKEDAAYLQNDLDQILKKEEILFFPDSFKRPGFFEKINRTYILQRTETINKLVNGIKPRFVVTYPEALFEKVIAPVILKDAQFTIKKDEIIDVETLIGILVEYGFERTDFVYEPGQFSIRGGIIDVFSYGNEWPYRIELFDDEVESIRTFNPTTQLSITNIGWVNFIPNVNTNFKSSDKESIFDVLPKDIAIWIKDFALLKEKVDVCKIDFESSKQKINDETSQDLEQLYSESAYVDSETIKTSLEQLRCIFINRQNHGFKTESLLEYNSKIQPDFNKNFKFLIEDLTKKRAAHYESFIFTSNARQVERFYNIFEDLQANIQFHPVVIPISKGFVDADLKIVCYVDHQIFGRFHKYKLKKGFTKEKALNLKMLREFKPGDYVTHIDHGVGRFSGLEKLEINGKTQESVRIIYKNNDILYVSINSLHKLSKYSTSEGKIPVLSKIGSDKWKNLKRKAKSKVKDIAKELIKLYAKRKATNGFAFPEDDYLQNELEASFIYEDTPDQVTTTQAVKDDMIKPIPMDRLICGDVGFGKTEIAIRAAFKAVLGGKQVAILVPTTILALQHYRTFKDRLASFGTTVDFVNRFKTLGERKKVFQKLKEGKIDIVIGTHGLLSKDVGFKDLGLLIIDEEQKFGVAAKEKLRNIKINVDTLTLTATPIPRTLQFSLLSARDLSVMRTAPPNRQPIHTEVRIFNQDMIKDAINYELDRGGQVFFVHNRVKNLVDMHALVARVVPDADIRLAHGQMDSKKLERTLVDFIDYKFDVLISTNIIETGLDIPNANTIIINNAHQFGMSDLHQLRGRVGRSNKKAYCYLMCPPMSTLTPEARKRLQALEELSDLGSGFDIAMKDLDIRGAGNMLGGEQSGFITDIGYETFQRILDDAITELKDTEFKELFKEELEKKRDYVKEVEIDTDVEMYIPSEYVAQSQERLNLYSEIDQITSEADLKAFSDKLVDRFGKLPQPVKRLFDGLRIRWVCMGLGFERLIYKNGKMRCYFISNPQSSFYETPFFNKFVQFIAQNGHRFNLSFKKTSRYFILVKDDVKSLSKIKVTLEKLHDILIEKKK